MDVEPDMNEDVIQTQEEQMTQPSTQTVGGESQNDHLWGYLNPCLSTTLSRVELYRDALEVKVGRSTTNTVVFPGFKISNYHAIIRWNGLVNAESEVTIEDLSSNGTYINGEKIGKHKSRILKDGNEVAFGVATTSKEHDGLFDYRFVFRDLVTGIVKRELYKYYDMSVELGKGSFATVYKALHMTSGEWVAVKVIHETKRQTNLTSDGKAKASREINVMESLQHPNICGLREVFWNANGSIDLVLELVQGGDLLDYILQNNGLSEPMSQHITYQLCQALAYIHGKGITHRDLKPENVLLTPDNPPIVKVADFGLAKVVDSMTMLKTMCGTPSYLAPEVVTQENNSGYDSLVDSWSVGVIGFSMLTNTNPFIEGSMQDLKIRIAERDIDWGQLDALQYGDEATGYYGVSDKGKDFITRLLDYNPQTRMKLSDALSHPWLVDHVPHYNLDYPEVARGNRTSRMGSREEPQDVLMRTAEELGGDDVPEDAAMSQGFQHLQLHGSSSADVLEGSVHGTEAGEGAEEPEVVTPSSTPPGLTLHRKNGLERRSVVLQRAAEMGQQLPVPSQEMVTYAQSQDDDLYRAEPKEGCAVEVNGSARKGTNKRVHSELTPLPEEVGETGGSSPLSSLGESPPVPARKKGRGAGVDGGVTPS
ncbi:kinase-like domain-containing protein, partial [Mycena rebaudengoi]